MSAPILIADAAVNPMLLEHPDRVYVSDGDPETCAATRRGLLPELVDQDVLTVCGHYPAGGIGRVVTRGDRVVWERRSEGELVFLKHKLLSPHGTMRVRAARTPACVSETQSLRAAA